MKVLYIVPKSNFFYKGYTGSVNHVLGITSGLHEVFTLDISANDIDALQIEPNCRRVVPNSLTALKTIIGEYDLVIVRYSISRVLYLFILRVVSLYYRVDVILEVNSLYGNTTSKFSGAIFRYVEKPILKVYKNVQVVSPNMRNWLMSRGVANVFYVPNGHNISEQLPCKFVKTESDSLIYIGSFKEYYNFQQYNRFCKSYNVIGNIYGSNDISGYPYLSFHGKFNFLTGNIVIFHGDILILPYKAGTLADIGFPIKLCEYLAMQLPIVCSNTGVLKQIMSPINAGLMYTDGDDHSLNEAYNFAKRLSGIERIKLLKKYSELLAELEWSHLARFIVEKRNYE
jgi:glycosyltransferase involved in cell wall biosynthesis